MIIFYGRSPWRRYIGMGASKFFQIIILCGGISGKTM